MLGFIALFAMRARAQLPTPGPDGHVALDIPKEPPRGSPFQHDPVGWANMRAMCQIVADKQFAHQPFEKDDLLACGRMRMTVRTYSKPRRSPSQANEAARPIQTPIPLPTPLEGPSPDANSPESINTSLSVGPFGTPFTGAGANACDPNRFQPVDLAADVSPTQIVEILNQGFVVFDKQGNTLAGPKTLANFWIANAPPPPPNKLTDTQIAYEPLAQRWLATTLSVPSTNDNGDLYFAISNTPDATGAWSFYKFSGICSAASATFPLPDQPMLGYNQSWAVIDVSCFDQNQIPFTDNDQLVLIPHAVLATHPQNLGATLKSGPTGTGANGWFASRPSRDVSGTANQNIFLVSSGPLDSPGSLDFVKITSIDATGNFIGPGPGNAIIQSPINGAPASDSFVINPAQHDNCGAGSKCVISLGDARISNAPILQTANDGKHYLLTSFHAGDNALNTSQALWFIGQTDSFATTNQWNVWFADSSIIWNAYPTITMDPDLDISYTADNFLFGSTIFPNWFQAKGFAPSGGSYSSPPLLGSGVLTAAQSTGAYTGKQPCDPTQMTQRWGDYMSMVWDPSFASPNESDAFWTAQEFTTGGSNQSTEFIPLQDPLPFFAGFSIPTDPRARTRIASGTSTAA